MCDTKKDVTKHRYASIVMAPDYMLNFRILDFSERTRFLSTAKAVSYNVRNDC